MSPVDRLVTRIKTDPHAPELQELSSLLVAGIHAHNDTKQHANEHYFRALVLAKVGLQRL